MTADFVDANIQVRYNLEGDFYEFSGTLHAKGENLAVRCDSYAGGKTLDEALKRGLKNLFSKPGDDESCCPDSYPTEEDSNE